jgi:hypothetical protein
MVETEKEVTPWDGLILKAGRGGAKPGLTASDDNVLVPLLQKSHLTTFKFLNAKLKARNQTKEDIWGPRKPQNQREASTSVSLGPWLSARVP